MGTLNIGACDLFEIVKERKMIEYIPYAAGIVTFGFGIAFYFFLEEIRDSE